MNKPFLAFALGLAVSSVSLAQQLSSTLDVSTAGMGGARFGMDIDSVEQSLGKPLTFKKGKTRSRGMNCTYGALVDLPGVDLRFERGRFMALYVSKPTVVTRSGLKVGDSEKTVIEKLKSDPTYTRGFDRYDESIAEIFVGRTQTLRQGQVEKLEGHVVKFTSKRGRVIQIQAGQAAWVTLSEQHEVCDE